MSIPLHIHPRAQASTTCLFLARVNSAQTTSNVTDTYLLTGFSVRYRQHLGWKENQQYERRPTAEYSHNMSDAQPRPTEPHVLPKAAFDAFDVAAAHRGEVEHYPLYAEDDRVRTAALRWVVAQLEIRRTAQSRKVADVRCLDVGCVHGRPTVQVLAEQGYRVTGLDLENGLLEMARRSGIRATFVDGDVRVWEPPPEEEEDGGGGLDAVTCFFVFCHFAREEYPVVLGRLARWLRPGGLLALGSDNVENGWKDFERNRAPISSASLDEFRTLLQGVGLCVEEAWEEDWQSPGRPDRPVRRHQILLCKKEEA